MRILLLLILICFVSCRPGQEATDYNVTDLPEIAVDPTDVNTDESNNNSDQNDENQFADTPYTPPSYTPPVSNETASNDPYASGTVTNQDVTYVSQSCASLASQGKLIEKTIVVEFPKAIECNFNESGSTASDLNSEGNGPRKNEYVRARIEQANVVTLDDKAVICDMTFNFPQQVMQYDDEIFLTLNNYVLMMSTNYSLTSSYEQYSKIGLALNSVGLVQYKWHGTNGLYNLDYGHAKAPQYCLGVSSSDKEKCNIPATETEGQIKLDIPSQEIIKIGLAGNVQQDSQNDTKLNFGFISTGDNDNGDCEHSAYSFEIKVQYYQI